MITSQIVQLTVFDPTADFHEDYKFPCRTHNVVPFMLMFDKKSGFWILHVEYENKTYGKIRMDDIIDWNRCDHDNRGGAVGSKHSYRPGRAPTHNEGAD